MRELFGGGGERAWKLRVAEELFDKAAARATAAASGAGCRARMGAGEMMDGHGGVQDAGGRAQRLSHPLR